MKKYNGLFKKSAYTNLIIFLGLPALIIILAIIISTIVINVKGRESQIDVHQQKDIKTEEK